VAPGAIEGEGEGEGEGWESEAGRVRRRARARVLRRARAALVAALDVRLPWVGLPLLALRRGDAQAARAAAAAAPPALGPWPARRAVVRCARAAGAVCRWAASMCGACAAPESALRAREDGEGGARVHGTAWYAVAHGLRAGAAVLAFAAMMEAWPVWFLRVNHPARLPRALFHVLLAAEAFTLLCVRAMASAILVPRVAVAGWVALVAWVLSSPYDFYGLGLAVLAMGLTHVSLAALRAFEVPALALGRVDVARPRGWLQLQPLPALPHELPEDVSLFHRPNFVPPV
jgi:hypothetical protein